MIGLCALIVITTLVTFAIDAYIYMTSTTKDMTVMLEELKKNAEIEENRSRILKQFCEFIEFHSQMTQLSDVYNCANLIRQFIHVQFKFDWK